MKVRHICVNWSLDDEELLEPYEWETEDDLEMIEKADLLHVSMSTLRDFYYGVLTIHHIQPGDYVCSDGRTVLALRLTEDGSLAYRSVLLLKDRQPLCQMAAFLPLTRLDYDLTARAERKEYGLTRWEREKKQWLLEHFAMADKNEWQLLAKLVFPLDKTVNQKRLMAFLERGYGYVHEYLYEKLSAPKRLS